MMEEILDAARKQAQEAEVYSATSQVTEARFEANRLKGVDTRHAQWWALRLIKDGRIGLAATSRPGADLVALALEMAPFGAEARFRLPSPLAYPPVDVFHPAAETASVEDMAALGQALIDGVRRGWPDLQCQAEVHRSLATVEIVNSQGGRASYRRSAFHLWLEGVLLRDTDMLFVGEGQSSCRLLTDARPVVDSTREQLEWARRGAPGLNGTYPVIFTPRGVASAFIFPLTSALNGQTVLQGASPLGGRLGQAALDPRFSLEDNATLPFRPGSRPCDDEGVPSQRTPLIQEGMVVNFLYDLQTAGQAGARSTGSASRFLGGLPHPAPSNLVLAPGQAAFEDMLAQVKEGLVVDRLIGSAQGNILGGEFSGNVLLGYRVEGGQIVGRVKDTMVSGNVYQLLRDTVLGRPAQWVGPSLLLPPLLCPRVSVASK